MDPSLYNSSRGGLPLHQLLELLEEDENIDSGNIDIYAIPPLDGAETDVDSDASDDDHEGNLNHLGGNMLRTICEMNISNNNSPLDEAPEEIFDSISEDSDPEMNVPLARFVKRKRPLVTWKQTATPKYGINKICSPKPPSDAAVQCKTPVDFFHLFLTENFLENIVRQSNLYAMQKNKPLNVTLDEIYVVMGAFLLSGYGKYPNKRLYWSRENDVPTILCESIRLNRFEQILRHIHLNDNDQYDPNDRLYKLRPIITELNEKFKLHGGLEENLSIDESMIPYYGKHYAKQFIRGKPVRFGFKNWALCHSTGYIVSFEIYTGKSPSTVKNFGIGGDVVLALIKSAEIPSKSGYKLFFDNYFSSVNLFKHLAENGFCAAATIQENRTLKCPLQSTKQMAKLPRGSYNFQATTEEDILLVRWKDNKVCTTITTFGTAEESSVGRWSREERKKIMVPQPQVFADYNKGMGGVDKIDQLIACYRTRMRLRKWWWPIFIYLFDATIVNSYLLMKKILPQYQYVVNLLTYRRYLAQHFLKTYGKPASRGKIMPNPLQEIRYDGRNHLPEYSATDKICRHCGSEAKFICTKCKVGLHPKVCFSRYHTA